MRIFTSLSLTYSVARDTGYWLSKRQATPIANRLRKVLDLTEHQRALVAGYLRGSCVQEELEMKFAPNDLAAVTGFMAWYGAEYTCPPGKSNLVSYVVANLNSGSICVFSHGGWKHPEAERSKLTDIGQDIDLDQDACASPSQLRVEGAS